MSRAEKWLAGFALLVVALQVAGAFLPGPHTWGFNAWAFLPRWLTAVLGGLTLLLFVPPVTRRVAGALRPLALRAGSPPGGRIVAVGAGALLALGFVLGRQRTFLLSDGALLLKSVNQGFVSFAADTMAAVIQLYAHVLLADVFKVTSASASFRVVAFACGIVWLAAIFATVGRLTKSGWGRLLLGGLLATAGLTKLFYGYVETGPLLAAAVAVYIWTGVRLLQDGRGILAATAAFLVAAGMHVTGLLLLPSYVFLVLRWAGRSPRRLGLAALAVLLPFAAYLGYWFSRGGDLSTIRAAYGRYFTEFIPLAGPLTGTQSFTFFSLPHLFEFLNEQLLLGPFALLALVVLLLARRPRPADAAGPGAGARAAGAAVEAPTTGAGLDASTAALQSRFFWFVLVPFLLLALTFNRRLGGGRDWDLLATVAVPSIFLVGLWVVRGVGRPEKCATLTVLLLGAALLHQVGWILVDAVEKPSLARFQALFAEGAPVSRFARSYALEEVGHHQLARGRVAEALAAYEAAVGIDPTNVHAQGTLGAWYTAAGRHAEALPLLQHAAQLRPDIAMNHYNLAAEWASRGRWDEAIREYRSTLHLGPGFPEAMVGLARAYTYLDRWAEADSTVRAGLSAFPQNADLRLIQGMIQEVHGRPEQALATYLEALKLDPNSQNALFNAGRLCLDAGRHAEAIVHLEKLVKLYPADAEGATNLGVACERANRREDAMRAFGQAIAADPKLPQPYLNLAAILQGQGRVEEARLMLESLLEKNPAAARNLGVPQMIEQLRGSSLAGRRSP